MKLLIIAVTAALLSSLQWGLNFDEALSRAKLNHKRILISFSGSDWCAPCIRFSEEILQSEEFSTYAGQQLILVKADFPRQKKNKLSAEQTKRNEALAERYNKRGIFPFTVLVDENGQVLQSWEGYPSNLNAQKFVDQLKDLK